MTMAGGTQPAGAMCGALADSGVRLSATMRQVSDPGRRAIGTWNIAETARHVAAAPGYFLAGARGEAAPTRLEDVAAVSARHLGEDRERDLCVLADRFDRGVGALVS
jgi:hypothetical protein